MNKHLGVAFDDESLTERDHLRWYGISGHCGCDVTAEKKGQYIYYHCTGNKGKCPEKYIREEEIARQFESALKTIQLDEEPLQLLVQTLKHRHEE